MHKLVDALAAFGPAGVFLIALLDSVGIPIPSGADFYVLLVAVKNPPMAFVAGLAAVAGSLIGNLGLFAMARGGGRRFVKPPEPGSPAKFRNWFTRYGLLTVFVPAVVPFLPLPLKAFVVSAGVFHTPLSRFIAVILAARLIRYFGEAWLGIRLGEGATEFFHHNAWTIAGVALALALVAVWIIRLNDRRRVES